MRETDNNKKTDNKIVTHYKCFEGKKGSETEERGPLLRGWLRKPSLRLRDEEGPFQRAEGSAPEASRMTRSVQRSSDELGSAAASRMKRKVGEKTGGWKGRSCTF